MTAGDLDAVKGKIMDYIKTADNDNLHPLATHVFSDWRINVYALSTDRFPVVTVRLGTATRTELVYGRKTKSDERGIFYTCPFTAHVWAENASTRKAKNAMDIADKITDYLLQVSPDSTTGIEHFYDITTRESQPDRGGQRISRVIIEGFCLVKRTL